MQNGAEQKLCDSSGGGREEEEGGREGGREGGGGGSFWSGTRVDVGSIAPVGSSEIC